MNTQINHNEIIMSSFPETQDLHEEFLKALIAGKHTLCAELAHKYLLKPSSIKALYEDILKKALYEVGVLWEFNKISVATEHLASAIVESILNQLYPEIISEKKNNKVVIAACVEKEFHQIGIKMISDLFEMNGWNALFLGSNTPTPEIISFMKIKNPDLLALSLSLYFNLPELEKMIKMVQSEFPDFPILVGGQAFQYGGQEILSRYDNVIFKSDLNSTELFIQNFK